ncbi:MAG: tetratricopeptide repeat protein [Calditrichales bacterium]|nr:MAG: tetratricopeptide repeat protein [Calditrichales bacterium]
MIGKTISHYKILEKLGSGGMGIVFKAEDNKLKRQVAIKFLPNQIVKNSDERKRFEIEAQAAAALNHPNIAHIYAIEEHDGELFIVMEYIDGKELKEQISKGPIELDMAIDMATQIASGLQAAHEKDIVHRDIKSSNIMITKKGKVKILDFGLAKIRGGVQVTKEQSTLGTAAYMSPEQARGEDVDHRSDIWSFGVVFYEMLNGNLPFKGDYEQAIIYSILNDDPKPLNLENSNVSLQLGKIVSRSLAKNQDERYQNTDELLADLKTIGDRQKGVDGKATVFPKKESKRKTPYIYSGIAVIIMLIALMSILFFPQKEQGITINTVAVLPFSNSRPDIETDYFGFAIADQIIGDLSYLRNITIRPSSSIRKYDKQVVDSKTAADELNVGYILAGNFLMEGNTIRLNVELVEVNTNEIKFRDQIEVAFKNAFELQDIVAKKVVESINAQFSQKEQSRITKDIPTNPLAYEYYLRGLAFPLTGEGNQLASEMLIKSIELDSTYAPAYSQLADRQHRVALYGKFDSEKYKRVEKIYQKAISLNNDLIGAQAGLAMYYVETARIEDAVEISNRLLEINPNNADALYSLGYSYRYAGLDHESILKMEKAIANDPRNPRFRSLSLSYCNVGEYDKALNVFELLESSDWVIGMKGYIFFKQGKNEQALEIFNQIINKEPDSFWGLASTTYKAIIQGDTLTGLQAMQKREQFNMSDSEPIYYNACDYALLGDKKGCLRSLEKAIAGGYFNYPLMQKEPDLDLMRDDPEFQKLLEKAKDKHLAFKKRFFN